MWLFFFLSLMKILCYKRLALSYSFYGDFKSNCIETSSSMLNDRMEYLVNDLIDTQFFVKEICIAETSMELCDENKISKNVILLNEFLI